MDRLKLSSSVDEVLSSSTRRSTIGEDAAETTGRYLVLFNQDAIEEGVSAMESTSGLRTARAEDFENSAVQFETLSEADTLVLPQIGAAAVAAEEDQIRRLRTGEDQPILAIEPERIVYAIASPAPTLQPPSPPAAPAPAPAQGAQAAPAARAYLQGYKDAVDGLINNLSNGYGILEGALIEPIEEIEGARTGVTWGLAATCVNRSRFSGRDIRIAVLDTGVDLNHPDFAGRPIIDRSFIPGEAAQDGNGHGTHCIGTACGPKEPLGAPARYGVAYESEIFAGKVLSDRGSGNDTGILAGINWAVANDCHVISMSLGGRPGRHFSQIYETVARRALWSGVLIVAAAGNESNRQQNRFSPVSHPANVPSILAVGAVDSRLNIANFSNRGLHPQGGRVDIVGPGVSVLSTWPMPTRYNTISGTSMATPHAAGIAALYAQQSNRARGALLWLPLVTQARQLPIHVLDDGWGLVQAP